MSFDFVKLVSAVSAALKAYETVSDIAEAIADTLADEGHPELKSALADLRAENDRARAARHAKLQEAARQ